jgi:hypothetical protein
VAALKGHMDMKLLSIRGAAFGAMLAVVGPASATNGGGDNRESAPPVEDTPSESAAVDRNPATGRLTIAAAVDSTGVGIVVDRATDSYYISANGQTVSYTIPQMAQIVSGGDAARASSFVSMVRSGLSRNDGFVGYQIGNEAFINRGGDIGNLGGPNHGSACSFSPCNANWVNGYGTNYRGLVLTPPWSPDPDLSGFSQDVIDYDKERFRRRQEVECGNRLGKGLKILLKTTGTGLACVAAETGVGAAICAIGVGETSQEIFDESDVDLCNKRYPGPGRWEE